MVVADSRMRTRLLRMLIRVCAVGQAGSPSVCCRMGPPRSRLRQRKRRRFPTYLPTGFAPSYVFANRNRVSFATLSDAGGWANRAHTCLQARISNTAPGENAETTNDRTQLNWEVVHADGDYSMQVPFGNAADEAIVVDN
eukprot:1768011-Rhodomonas_salina.2